jgi:hypothetical protein
MKAIFSLVIFVSATAFATEQSIVCHETTKTGAVKANGTTMSVKLVINQNGKLSNVQSEGSLTGTPKVSFGDLMVSSIQEAKQTNTGIPYAIIFMSPMHGYDYDITLQFDGVQVTERNFRNVPAVVGIADNGSTSEGWGTGFDVLCNSYVR